MFIKFYATQQRLKSADLLRESGDIVVTWRLGRHQPSCMETSDLFIYLFFILYILLRPQRLCVLCYLSVCVRQSFSFCVFEKRRLNSECPSGSVHLSCWIVCCCCCMLSCVCLSWASVAVGESSRAPLYYFASLVFWCWFWAGASEFCRRLHVRSQVVLWGPGLQPLKTSSVQQPC